MECLQCTVPLGSGAVHTAQPNGMYSNFLDDAVEFPIFVGGPGSSGQSTGGTPSAFVSPACSGGPAACGGSNASPCDSTGAVQLPQAVLGMTVAGEIGQAAQPVGVLACSTLRAPHKSRRMQFQAIV